MTGNRQAIPAKPDATAIVVRCELCGKYLGIARKDNDESFGLVGGKIDPEDLSPEDAARRELLEETGLQADGLFLADVREWDGRLVYYYLADVRGRLLSNKELAKIGEANTRWVDKEILFNGYFGQYNKIVIPEVEKRFPCIRLAGIKCDEHQTLA